MGMLSKQVLPMACCLGQCSLGEGGGGGGHLYVDLH